MAGTETSLSPKAQPRRGDQLCHFVFPSPKLHLVQLMFWLLRMRKELRLALSLGLTQLPVGVHQMAKGSLDSAEAEKLKQEQEGALLVVCEPCVLLLSPAPVDMNFSSFYFHRRV